MDQLKNRLIKALPSWQLGQPPCPTLQVLGRMDGAQDCSQSPRLVLQVAGQPPALFGSAH